VRRALKIVLRKSVRKKSDSADEKNDKQFQHDRLHSGTNKAIGRKLLCNRFTIFAENQPNVVKAEISTSRTTPTELERYS
jgi:hypothetical protein